MTGIVARIRVHLAEADRCHNAPLDHALLADVLRLFSGGDVVEAVSEAIRNPSPANRGPIKDNYS